MLVGHARLESSSSSLADAVALKGCPKQFRRGFVTFTHPRNLFHESAINWKVDITQPRSNKFLEPCMLAPLRNRRHCVARGGSSDDISVTIFSRMAFTKKV